ncbi:hypothetical protein GCM10007424_23460 [Flavobacterium suaedae]|uniref:Uncharacterized protein n=1 Tax=Flavobacterium suaedae TaxID=1767027 RepID=A0ABQ1K1Z9_9FLAO|nr:hypothetical protein [Flavobacterium suaedae]GGB82731.1 hypothetical protein GCM10007424_23460 [Flavobacterium suaedae]
MDNITEKVKEVVGGLIDQRHNCRVKTDGTEATIEINMIGALTDKQIKELQPMGLMTIKRSGAGLSITIKGKVEALKKLFP